EPVFSYDTGQSDIMYRPVIIGAGNGTVRVPSGNLTFAGALSGPGRLSKSDFGHLSLIGDGSGYSGTISINNGFLSANSSAALGDGSATNGLKINAGTAGGFRALASFALN